ncbi:MAG: DUF4214 domain-containing protein [Pirellulales bacterium]
MITAFTFAKRISPTARPPPRRLVEAHFGQGGQEQKQSAELGALINEDYFHYLGRAADPAGLAFWLQQFADGATKEDVIADFTGSAEYYTEHT